VDRRNEFELIPSWPKLITIVKNLLKGKSRYNTVKGLILAQNERWRHGLGMQVERMLVAIQAEVAKGAVMYGYLPWG
jgi:hypothetical protein